MTVSNRRKFLQDLVVLSLLSALPRQLVAQIISKTPPRPALLMLTLLSSR